mmetsp:Transcript_52322/g.59798  ORF Transcript_52322/g.59798 Transcript_52322/m.59798 type:complete len:82 (+) Transcript_52322:101-346(+)
MVEEGTKILEKAEGQIYGHKILSNSFVSLGDSNDGTRKYNRHNKLLDDIFATGTNLDLPLFPQRGFELDPESGYHIYSKYA